MDADMFAVSFFKTVVAVVRHEFIKREVDRVKRAHRDFVEFAGLADEVVRVLDFRDIGGDANGDAALVHVGVFCRKRPRHASSFPMSSGLRQPGGVIVSRT